MVKQNEPLKPDTNQGCYQLHWEGKQCSIDLFRTIMKHFCKFYTQKFDLGTVGTTQNMLSQFSLDYLAQIMNHMSSAYNLTNSLKHIDELLAEYTGNLDRISQNLDTYEKQYTRYVNKNDNDKLTRVRVKINNASKRLRENAFLYYNNLVDRIIYVLLIFVALVLDEDNIEDTIANDELLKKYFDEIYTQLLGDTWIEQFSKLNMQDIDIMLINRYIIDSKVF